MLHQVQTAFAQQGAACLVAAGYGDSQLLLGLDTSHERIRRLEVRFVEGG